LKVQTNKGLLQRSELVVTDIISDEDNARVTATEWRYGDELVRRDVNVNILRGIEMSGEQQEI